MPKEKPITFIVSDESVNSYGFWIVSNGLQTDQFNKNPLMLYCHQRPSRYDTTGQTTTPIGRWENLRLEGSEWKADAIFDQTDEFAKKVEQKVINGFIRMASIGVEALTVSSDPQYIKSGQTRETLVKSKLLEISIVDIGSNDNAVALYDEHGQQINLSKDGSNNIPLLKEESNNQKNDKMKQLALFMAAFATANIALGADATEDTILAKVKEVISLNKQLVDDLANEKQKNAAVEAKLAAITDGQITLAVDGAFKEGKITADKKEMFAKLGKDSGLTALQNVFAAMQSAVKPSNLIKSGDGNPPKDTTKKYRDHSVEELETLKRDDLSTYIALYKDEYGFEPGL